MDLETENRIASILMREAAELRRQADKEGVHAYLLQPKVRGRPNSRFLTATVRGVQQANRVVEMGEMWRVRQKEIENRLRGKSRDGSSHRHHSNHSPSTRETETTDAEVGTPRKRKMEDCNTGENGSSGLRDEEVEEFLHSRVKRGRGAVGSRMDETGPYLPSRSDLDPKGKFLACPDDAREREDLEHRALLGPDKPSFLKKTSRKSSSESDSDHEGSWRKEKKDKSRSSSKKHYPEKKHKSKDKYRDKKKTKKSNHHRRSRSE
ncbi:hypothetical protein MKW98_010309 [Papaver atlanticum]|uniref:Uncharacterized protein n=1 Tax=Papaver atlanticum TaxID=357466 RepID=A0AAD4SK51_9MAGN|nr:hypothetical protein MKW98_010309 [Papaver atlanticum]